MSFVYRLERNAANTKSVLDYRFAWDLKHSDKKGVVPSSLVALQHSDRCPTVSSFALSYYP